MKRILAALAATTLLAACSSGTNSGSGSSGSADDQTLTIASVDQGSIEDVVEAAKR